MELICIRWFRLTRNNKVNVGMQPTKNKEINLKLKVIRLQFIRITEYNAIKRFSYIFFLNLTKSIFFKFQHKTLHIT